MVQTQALPLIKTKRMRMNFIIITSSFSLHYALSQVESLKVGGVVQVRYMSLSNSPSASSDLCISLRLMPNLAQLAIENISLHDNFFSTLKSGASHMKVYVFLVITRYQ